MTADVSDRRLPPPHWSSPLPVDDHAHAPSDFRLSSTPRNYGTPLNYGESDTDDPSWYITD